MSGWAARVTICRRRRDGAFFQPGHPENWSEADALLSIFQKGTTWYFRRVRLVFRRWWFGSRWERTGEIWEFADSSGENQFDVLADREARRLWRLRGGPMRLTKEEILLILSLIRKTYGSGYAKDSVVANLQGKLSIMLEAVST